MHSKDLLKATKKIQVFIDSKTFDDLLNDKDRVAIAILRHYDSDYLEFVRDPMETNHKELENIIEYEMILKDSGAKLKIKRKNLETGILFGYKTQDIEAIAKKICGKDTPKKFEVNNITKAFIQAAFNRHTQNNIFIINNKILLKNRTWLECKFPGCPLNIMSVEEASIFLDLFFKKNGNYYASSRYHLNKGYWYRLSMQLKIPHYEVSESLINTLSTRFSYGLMALDEIGIQYYLGVNNDTQETKLYHFNYLIALITGMFDNLALVTNKSLGINHPFLTRINLNQDEFVKKIGKQKPDIRRHIQSNNALISLIYYFREQVVHRELPHLEIFENVEDGNNWVASFIPIPKQEVDKIHRCGDRQSKYDPFTQWGVYKLSTHNLYFLEPFHFSEQLIKKLTLFIDTYLQLLGYSDFIKSQENTNTEFANTLGLYKRFHLGF